MPILATTIPQVLIIPYHIWRFSSFFGSAIHLQSVSTILLFQVDTELHICSSVHRNCSSKKSNKMQQYADIYLLLNYSACFGCPSRPSSGVHKTVVAASGTDHTTQGASVFKHDQIRSPYLVTFEDARFPDSMICTRGCNYSFMYS